MYRCPKRTFILLQNILLQFDICYHETYYATSMPLEKIYYMKTTTNFWDPGTNPLQNVESRTLFYPKIIMPKTFIEDSSNIKHPKNVKDINNSTSSHPVSCFVIPRPATMKGWKKEVFWKTRVLGNLKCNKSNTLKSR